MPVTFKDNPDAAAKQYWADGFFIEPDVLSAAECDRLIQLADNLSPAIDGTLIPIMQVHRLEPAFLDVLSHPRIVAMMDRIFGAPAIGVQTQLYYTPPQRAGLGLHQDNYFVEAPDDSYASAWVALVDVNKENGGLYAYVASHNEGCFPVKPVGADGLDKRQTVYEETVLPREFKKVDVSVKKGSAVLLHGMNVHGSYPNHSTSNRYVILNTYVKDGAAFRPGQTAKRERIVLNRP